MRQNVSSPSPCPVLQRTGFFLVVPTAGTSQLVPLTCRLLAEVQLLLLSRLL